MKPNIAYIAHCIGATADSTIEENLADLRRIVRHINLTMSTVLPFVPYYVDVVSLDETNPVERERGISNNMAILRSGVVQELWLTGPRLSPGMRAERQLALDMKIPIMDYIGRI